LEGRKLSITYYVRNDDEKTMYFGVGGHPGFNVPFEKGVRFEEYYLKFDSVEGVKRVGFSEDCFVTGELEEFSLEDGIRLPLSHDMFDDDAIVLTNMASSVTLKSKTGVKSIRVSYPDMSYLGIWHMPKTDAPYICIEPWSSLPSRKGIVEDIEKQSDLISLNSNCEYENQIAIEIIKTK
jgi:galactose mutarotase-like enzyme